MEDYSQINLILKYIQWKICYKKKKVPNDQAPPYPQVQHDYSMTLWFYSYKEICSWTEIAHFSFELTKRSLGDFEIYAECLRAAKQFTRGFAQLVQTHNGHEDTGTKSVSSALSLRRSFPSLGAFSRSLMRLLTPHELN